MSKSPIFIDLSMDSEDESTQIQSPIIRPRKRPINSPNKKSTLSTKAKKIKRVSPGGTKCLAFAGLMDKIIGPDQCDNVWVCGRCVCLCSPADKEYFRFCLDLDEGEIRYNEQSLNEMAVLNSLRK